MADRPEVRTAAPPIAAIDTVALAGQIAGALARVPFRSPWQGDSRLAGNLGKAVTREVIRTFMGYASSLPIEEFRSIERLLDDVCKVVMPPIVRALKVETETTTVAGVPGIWYRPTDTEVIGTILYLHGGGYIGTSPTMYAYFTAELARACRCEVFVADYRLAPEFPYPAGADDAVAVLRHLLDRGVDPARLFVAGDSGGGGLACTLEYDIDRDGAADVAGILLFSPEVDLGFDRPSITENAPYDILPWNLPTQAYLRGTDLHDASVSALAQDVSRWPATFVAFGDKEMFRDLIVDFVRHLEASGVRTEVFEAVDMFHVYPIVMPWADSSRRMYREIGRFVARVAGS